MTIPEEILAAEERMQVRLTARQRETVEAWLDGRQTFTHHSSWMSYASKAYLSVLEARKR